MSLIESIWSCDPKDIRPWTQEEVDSFHKVLRYIFDSQEDLPRDMQKVLEDNINDLYEE